MFHNRLLNIQKRQPSNLSHSSPSTSHTAFCIANLPTLTECAEVHLALHHLVVVGSCLPGEPSATCTALSLSTPIGLSLFSGAASSECSWGATVLPSRFRSFQQTAMCIECVSFTRVGVAVLRNASVDTFCGFMGSWCFCNRACSLYPLRDYAHFSPFEFIADFFQIGRFVAGKNSVYCEISDRWYWARSCSKT